MKKRIIKKKENRMINEYILSHIRKNDKNYFYLRNVDAEKLLNFRYLFVNNQRSSRGIPKKDLKKFYRDCARLNLLMTHNKLYY